VSECAGVDEVDARRPEEDLEDHGQDRAWARESTTAVMAVAAPTRMRPTRSIGVMLTLRREREDPAGAGDRWGSPWGPFGSGAVRTVTVGPRCTPAPVRVVLCAVDRVTVAAVHAAAVAASVHRNDEDDQHDPQPVAGEELDHDAIVAGRRGVAIRCSYGTS